MKTMDNVKEYYRLITELDIAEVACQLLQERVTQQTPQRLMCDCPNHKSQSHRSLHIMLDKQGWYCFGCGVGGDVLQLVEFIQSAAVTAGKSGPMPDSHRQARDYLAEKAGLPPLSRYGLSQERLAKTEADRAFKVRVKEALTALARFYHARLKESPKVLEWLKSKYAISDDTIDDLLIGYADNSSGVITALTEAKDTFTLRELSASGAFKPTSQDGLNPFFDKRIIFPYWSRGRVAFMIGRKTPWTPDTNWEKGKYKKLPVHDEHHRPYIARFINNAVLYNEDCLLAKPARVIITEGVTDCIALMQQGLSAVSPVTVRIRAADWERLIPKLRGVETVYICQDNEISQAGLKGALQTARKLAEHRIDTRLVTLPLADAQLAARKELAEKFDVTTSVGPKELAKLLAGRPAGDLKEAEALLAASKIDVNDYFRSGHTRVDFEKLIDQGRVPIEFAIDSLPTDKQEREIDRALEPVLAEIAKSSALEQTRLLKGLQTKLGKDRVSITTLREQIKHLQRKAQEAVKRNRRQERVRAKRSSNAPVGSCRARIEEVLIETELDDGAVDYTRAAEAAYDWFAANGAMFFRTRQGEPIMCFKSAIYWMDSGDRGRKRLYSAMLFKHTGMVPTNNGGRTFFEVLASLATDRGRERDHFSWLHTDINRQTIWFNLNNKDHQIAKITPDGVEIMSNGNNPDGVILTDSRKMKPICYLPGADPEQGDRLLAELILNNLTCGSGDRLLIFAWLCCFLLVDFSSTKPMTRFEGPSGSGKTTASKLISTLLYGDPQHKKSTIAANYTDGSQNPLVVLDNIEVKQMTEELTSFMLTSITGVAREKRRGGTDTETVTEQTKCLINTTGIEPLCGDLAEILSRTFTIDFDLSNQGSCCFLEAKAIADIQAHRDLILSVIIKRTALVLDFVRQGKQKQIMELIHASLGGHDKRRCNEYLSLMYLMMLAGGTQEEIRDGLETLNADFIGWLHALNATSRETARISNPIASALHTLFDAYANALKLDEKARYNNDDRANHVAGFIERYQVEFQTSNALEPLFAGRLFSALKRITRDFGLSFGFKDAGQLAKRLFNDKKLLADAGFNIERQYNSHSKSYRYHIRRKR
jgi:DNA primase